MSNFQYFVHRTAGLIDDINTTNNPCEGAFYRLSQAIDWGNQIKDRCNFTAIYDVNGKLHTVLPRV